MTAKRQKSYFIKGQKNTGRSKTPRPTIRKDDQMEGLGVSLLDKWPRI